jgi:hypothetical protein
METLNYTAFIPEIWEYRLNKILQKTPMMQCINRDYEGDIKNKGDTVKIQSEDYLVIDQKKFFAFKVNDIAQAQTNQNIMEAHLRNAKKAIEEVQDEYLLNQHTNVIPENVIGLEESPVELNKNTIYEKFVELALKLKNVPENNQKPWVVINPTIESYLLQCPEFISAYNIDDETLREGSIGRIAGMDVLISTNLTAENNNFYVLAGTNDAITFASQLSKIESLRDKDSFCDLVRGLYLYEAKTVQPKSLAKMITTVAS